MSNPALIAELQAAGIDVTPEDALRSETEDAGDGD
jgi:hypothetical protein